VQTYAVDLRERLTMDSQRVARQEEPRATHEHQIPDRIDDEAVSQKEASPQDFRANAISHAKEKLREDDNFWEQLDRSIGIPWFVVRQKLEESLPATLSDPRELAGEIVSGALNELVGPEGEKWHTERRPSKQGKDILWIVKGVTSQSS
jgi:hypothetical protein